MWTVPKEALPALQLTRPLVIYDLETTGLHTKNDRIVQIAAVKVHQGSEHVVSAWVMLKGLRCRILTGYFQCCWDQRCHTYQSAYVDTNTA